MAMALAKGAFTVLKMIKPTQWKGMKGAMKATKEAGEGAKGIIGLLKSLDAVRIMMKPLTVLFKIFNATLLQAMMPAIQKLFDVMLSPEMIEIMMMLAEIVAALLIPALEMFVYVLRALIPQLHLILPILVDIVNYMSGVLMVVIKVFGTALVGFAGIFTSASQIIRTPWDNLLKPMFDGMLNLWNLLGSAYVSIVEPIFAGIVGLFDWINAGWNWALKPALLAVKGGFDWIAGVFKGFLNIMIGFANEFIGLVNLIPGVSLAKIPMLDTGGDILKSGLAIVHAKETVLNPEDAAAYKAGRGGGGEGRNVFVTFNLNGAVIADSRSIDALSRKIYESLWEADLI